MAEVPEDFSNDILDKNVPRQQGKKLPQYVAALIVNITSIVHGAGLAWLSPNLTILQSEDSPIGRPISNEEGSWLGSLLCLGACIGTPVYHLLTYYCSRKLTGYLVALPYLITYILTIRADSIFILYIARFISGLGTAATTAFCPIYVTEISQVTERGSLGTFFILIRNIGVLSIYVLGAYATFVTSAYILLCTTILYIFTFYFVPESPLYCMSKNNFAKARMSLIWLRGNREDVIDYELSEIATSLRQKQSLKSTSFVEMISSRGNRRGMAIALLLVTNLQFCAPLPILAYTHTIFEAAGSKLSPNISSIIAATLYIAGSAMSTFLMDRAGRKILLIISNFSLFSCLGIMGLYFYFKSIKTDVSSFQWLPLLCLSIYIVSVSVGVLTIPFLMIPELFPPEARNLATCISITIMWLMGFTVTKTFAILADVLGLHSCFWIFSSCCFAGFLLSIYVTPETKNRRLQSIVEELNADTFPTMKFKSKNRSIRNP